MNPSKFLVAAAKSNNTKPETLDVIARHLHTGLVMPSRMKIERHLSHNQNTPATVLHRLVHGTPQISAWSMARVAAHPNTSPADLVHLHRTTNDYDISEHLAGNPNFPEHHTKELVNEAPVFIQYALNRKSLSSETIHHMATAYIKHENGEFRYCTHTIGVKIAHHPNTSDETLNMLKDLSTTSNAVNEAKLVLATRDIKRTLSK